MNNESKANDAVNKLLKENDVNHYRIDYVKRDAGNGYTVNLTYNLDNTVTFKMLDKLSEVFETKEIDIERINGSGGGCESCGYGADESRIEIYLRNVPNELLE